MNKTDTLDKSEMYTLVGTYAFDNFFTDLNGDTYKCYAYRILNEQIGNGKLCAINIKWVTGMVNAWVIFQYVLLDDIEKKDKSDE